MASVTLKGLSKNFGAVAAVASLDLEIANGEFLTLARSLRLRQKHGARLHRGIGAAERRRGDL